MPGCGEIKTHDTRDLIRACSDPKLSMKTTLLLRAACLAAALACANAPAAIIYERISAYHRVRVIDDQGVRTLSFNNSQESRMSLANPLRGHFQYTEYFQMPWVWNRDVKRVLMAGLGGGSTQRAYQHYATNVTVHTVELDPVVVSVAEKYFGVTETARHQIFTDDARVFLRRTTNTYDVILMDAYSTTRYGSSLPPHLTTKEFFTIASQHLGTNGVLAYNVIGQIDGWRANVIGALYRTMKEVFPQVYLFPAEDSQNVVMIGTKSKVLFDLARVRAEGEILTRSGTMRHPAFNNRLRFFSNKPPAAASRSPVLTDDFAPIESLLNGGQ
jgi:spermidine synthase